MKLFILMALVASSSAWAGDAVRGQSKAQACVACHGANGASPTGPDFPLIAGQPQDYLVRALLDYKTGARKNVIMASQVSGLSRQDIEDLAAYFSVQASSLYVK